MTTTLYIGPTIMALLTGGACVWAAAENRRRARAASESEQPSGTVSPPWSGFAVAALQLYLNYRLAHLGDLMVFPVLAYMLVRHRVFGGAD